MIQVAVLYSFDINYDDWHEGSQYVSFNYKITDWAVLLPEDFEILKKYLEKHPYDPESRLYRRLLIKPTNQQAAVDKLVSDVFAEAKAEEAKAAAKREKARLAREKAALTRKEKQIAKAKAILNQYE